MTPFDPAVQLYDTTLRDGMQGPGMSLSVEEKVRVAHALDSLGFQILKNEIERHVETEELELFPLIKNVFRDSELREMGEDLAALKLLVEETAFMPPPGLKPGGSSRGARPDAPDYDRHG